jgi:hypothetical protein
MGIFRMSDGGWALLWGMLLTLLITNVVWINVAIKQLAG